MHQVYELPGIFKNLLFFPGNLLFFLKALAKEVTTMTDQKQLPTKC